MTQTRARGPYAKSADRRATIARAAHDVVMEVGHQALTTAAVAKRAGMSERTMLYHYPTRDHLLVAALELADDETATVVIATAEAVDSMAKTDWLELMLEQMTRLSVNGDNRTRLHVHLAALAQNEGHPAREYFERNYARAVNGMASQIRMRQEAGLAHPDKDPVTVARRVVGAWDGLQAQWLVNRDFDLPTEILGTFRDLTGQSVMETRQAMEELLAQI